MSIWHRWSSIGKCGRMLGGLKATEILNKKIKTDIWVLKKKIYGSGHETGGRNVERVLISQNAGPFPQCSSDSSTTLTKDHIR